MDVLWPLCPLPSVVTTAPLLLPGCQEAAALSPFWKGRSEAGGGGDDSPAAMAMNIAWSPAGRPAPATSGSGP